MTPSGQSLDGIDDDEVRYTALRHPLGGARERLVRRDRDGRPHRRATRALLVERADGRCGDEVEVRDDAPQQARVRGVIGHDHAVHPFVAHERGNSPQRRLRRATDEPMVHRVSDLELGFRGTPRL